MQLPHRIEAEVPSKTWEITTGGPVGTQKSRWYCVDKTLVRLGGTGADRRLTCQSAFCGRNCSHSNAVLVAFPGLTLPTDAPDDFVMGEDEPAVNPVDAVNHEATGQQSSSYEYPCSSKDAQRMRDLELGGIRETVPDSMGRKEYVLCPPAPECACPHCNKEHKLVIVRRNCTVYLPRPQYAKANVCVAEWRCGCPLSQHKYHPRDDALWHQSADVFISVR
jgi:hypothetical protein